MEVRLVLGSAERGSRWLLRPTIRALAAGRTAGTAPAVSVSANQVKLKSEEDLAEITALQMLYRMTFKGYLKTMHELQVYEKQLHGPIYKVRVGKYRAIVLNSAELLEELLRKDEKFPCRGDMTLWTEYRDMKGLGYGPFTDLTSFTICHYSISQDEKTFPEPHKFRPERWLRDGRQRPNPFGSLPFGFGVRGCVGRRIAELEMHLALSRIISLFEIRLDPHIGEVKAHNRTVLVADRQVNLHFVERNGTSSN
ncbi:sterol 26-hydroxylase, mitochondrial-like [Anguilla rostrata]|uniref:sterol 26-hydroxylase, mitochondrial-like n=1 Tax=Anguilla rostrata TaxID=7938 RepID=UPI0030D0C8B6